MENARDLIASEVAYSLCCKVDDVQIMITDAIKDNPFVEQVVA